MTNGGRRPGSGRRHRDTLRVGCSLLRPVYLELVRQEKLTGVYRCQIVGRIVTAHLVGWIVDRELADAGFRHGPNGSNGQELLERMAKQLAEFHRMCGDRF